MTIADIMARILNKQAEILGEDPTREAAADAKEFRARAEAARRRLVAEVGFEEGDEDMAMTYHLGDSAFDKLVPEFFR
jgi:Rod binding domain-containing protein